MSTSLRASAYRQARYCLHRLGMIPFIPFLFFRTTLKRSLDSREFAWMLPMCLWTVILSSSLAAAYVNSAMAWRFRKSFSPLPGVRLTLSKRGLSTSIGAGPFRLRVGSRGPAVTTTIPGTGLSFSQPLGSNRQPRAVPRATPPTPGFVPAPIASPPATQPLAAIQSAGSDALTTAGLTEFKKLFEQARRQHGEISTALARVRAQEATVSGKVNRWHRGWILKHLFKAKLQRMRDQAELLFAERVELEEQEQLSRLQTEMDVPDVVNQAFQRLCDAFAALSGSLRIWDTVGMRRVNQAAERTTASRVIERKPVQFGLGKCEVIDSQCAIPHLENANGGDIFFYPAFVLYFTSRDRFALLEYNEIAFAFQATSFIEEEAIPADSKMIGQTWAKANKDGSPDRRFSSNYQIPVVRYGQITLRSGTGMHEEYMISNCERTAGFADAWESLVKAVIVGA
jgi:hypothetical protein